MPTRGTVAARPSLGRLEFIHFDELRASDALHDQLRDPVAPGELERFDRVEVHQADLDLTAVSGVDGARRVDDRQTHARGQSRPRVHETRIPGRERDRHPGPRHGALPRLEHHVLSGHEIGTGIVGPGVGREGNVGIDAGKQDLHAGHGWRDYPGPVSTSARARPDGEDPMPRPDNAQGNRGNSPEARSATEPPTNEPELRFSERLYMAWWCWPLPLVGAALLAAEVHMGYPGVRAWLPYVILLPLAALLLLGFGRLKIRLTGGDDPELWVGDAHLPLRHVGAVEVIGKDSRRKTLGPELDPASFVINRGWIATLVRVEITDPEDPTPYWLFSTRYPERLAALLREARPPLRADDAAPESMSTPDSD